MTAELTSAQRRALEATGCEVRSDALTRVLYATDASIYKVEPLAVAFPTDAGQTGRLLAAAAGALRERDALRQEGGDLRFVTRLPRREPSPDERSVGGGAVIRPPAPEGPPAPTQAGERPTHLLLGHLARPLTEELLVVGGLEVEHHVSPLSSFSRFAREDSISSRRRASRR